MASLLTPVCASQRYAIVDLGILSGCIGGEAYSINNSGQVVGRMTGSAGYSYAFYWSQSSGMVKLSSPANTLAGAYGINDKGQIVGQYSSHATTWDATNHQMTDLTQNPFSMARDINENGQIAGVSYGGNDAFILEKNGTKTDLGCYHYVFACSDNAINNNGWVAGYGNVGSMSCAWLWKPTTGIVKLNPLDVGTNASANDLDEAGRVVGLSYNSAGVMRAVSWDVNGAITDLGWNGDARSINETGQIVGTAVGRSTGAVVRQTDGSIVDLCTLGGNFAWAYSINDKGQIVGTAADASGRSHAVLWQPVPEPSSILALLGGIGGLGGMLLRKQK